MSIADIKSCEYEVLAEVPIVGEVGHQDFRFRIWEFCQKPAGEKRKLCLRVEVDNDGEYEMIRKRVKRAAKNGFYTNLSRHQEIVVLSSLFLHRRLTMPTMVRMGDSPTIIALKQYNPCWSLQQGSSNLAELKSSFEIWDGAQEEYQIITLLF